MTFHTLMTKVKKIPWPIFALAIAALLLMGIQEVADDVMEGDTHEVDTHLLMMLRESGDVSDPLGPTWVEEIMRDISALGGIAVLTLMIIGASAYALMQKRYLLTGYILFSSIIGTILSNVLKAGFDRPRPDFIPHDIVVYTASFPSGHAMMSAVVYLTLGALLAEATNKRGLRIFWAFWAVELVLLIGISRIYLGVHWPSDVLFGWMIGSLWALLCWVGLKWIEKRKRV